VTTNGAYTLATNWLSRFKVNHQELEAKYGKPVIYTLPYRNEQGEIVPTAFYYVRWGQDSDGAADVSLLGTTGELMELRVDDDALNGQPPLQLPNWRELMKTPEKQLERGTSPAAPRKLERPSPRKRVSS